MSSHLMNYLGIASVSGSDVIPCHVGFLEGIRACGVIGIYPVTRHSELKWEGRSTTEFRIGHNLDLDLGLGNGAVFIGKKTQRSLRAVLAVPDISRGR
ncbi:hypothetical protein Tco_1360140 [Tanacetum coccineum]